MSDSLRTKQQLLDEQRRENAELLATLMPAPVAQRYRDGETTISSDYRDVSVLYAELLNFKDFSGAKTSEDSVRLLNTLIEAFDAAAEHHGIERVRNLHNGFLATCGLVVPRVDHASRIASFAVELVEIVDLFNEQHGAQLALRVGIDSGPVSSGLIGQRSKIYDLWGEAVDLAHRVHAATNQPGIFTSTRVRDPLGSVYTFTEAGTIPGADGDETVWSLRIPTRSTT